jgi:hypothetical protein
LASGFLSDVMGWRLQPYVRPVCAGLDLLAMMKSASQVPDKLTCSKHEGVPRGVLITGSPFGSSLPHCTCQPKTLRRRLRRRDCSVNFSGFHDRPCDAGELIGQGDHHKFGRATFEKLLHPDHQWPLPLVKPTQMCCCGQHQKLAEIGMPCLLIRPKRSLPPLDLCFGKSPIQAAKSRPERKTLGSGAVAAMAAVISGPKRGTVLKT